MRIDSHQHFWKLERGDYHWMSPELTDLYRDFLPEDLAPKLVENAIDGSVLVQAAATVAETDYMLSLAEKNNFIKGVVGWVDFDGVSVIDDLCRLAEHPKFKGVRPMIQDIENPDWMLSDWLAPVFEELIALNLTFDALVKPQHLSNLLILLKRYPSLKVVIDHGAKPDIADGQFNDWWEGLDRIAGETSAYCKVSGLWTEAGGDTDEVTIKPYVEALLKIFGPSRLMWGSDWPVLNLAGNYGDWHQQSMRLITHLSPEEQASICGETARRFYDL